MADTYCPTCMEPWDMGETKVVKEMKRTHRCPCCKDKTELPTDGKLEEKLEMMMMDCDYDDGDPMDWF